MALVVHKYGGSSVADAEKILKVARHIARVKSAGMDIVVVVSAMGNTTDDLIHLAHTISPDPDLRELDLLLSTGELVSCTLLTMALRALGHDAISLSGYQAGIHTDTMYGKARIHRVDPERIRKELEKGRLVVVAGFQGITEDLDITTLGRGGSDTTAVALAAALGAQRCDIYTDVEGIYTADPRIVPQARKLPEISYQEMLELANHGAKMHPRSVELGAAYRVPIYVASSFCDAPGTLIHQGPDESQMEDRIKVTGIAYQTNVAKITVRSVPNRPGIAAALFEPLAKAGISVDTIVQNTSVERTTDISFTVTRTDLPRALREVESVLSSIGASGVVSDSTLASVSIVGSGIQNTPGYASHMFCILAEGNLNIDMIATSEMRISCIIKGDRVAEAVRLLHRGFQLDQGLDGVWSDLHSLTNVEFLADLFDQPPEAVRQDPEATKQSLLGLFAEAAYFFDSVKSGDEAWLETARRQVAGLADVLRRHGVTIGDAIHDLPDYLAQVYRHGSDETPTT